MDEQKKEEIMNEMSKNLIDQINVLLKKYGKVIREDKSLDNFSMMQIQIMATINMLLNIANQFNNNDCSEDIRPTFMKILQSAFNIAEQEGFFKSVKERSDK